MKLRISELVWGLLGLGVVALHLILPVLEPQIRLSIDPDHLIVLHSLVELGAILIGFSIFIVNWEATKQSLNTKSLFVATGFVTIVAADTMHALSFPGMPSFGPANEINRSFYYWIYARLWFVSIMLASAFVHPARGGLLSSRIGLLAANVAGALVPLVVFTYWSQSLPPLIAPGGGLTPLKYGLEYLIIAGTLAGALLHYSNPIRVTDEPRGMVVAALLVSSLGELPFAGAGASFGVHMLVGHLLKALSYYLVFRALLVTSVRRPYVQLQIAKDSLEETVSELDSRNRELDALVDVAITLTGSLNPSQVLRSAIDKATKVMGAEAGAIFLREEDSNRLRMVAWEGLPKEMEEQFLSVPPVLRTGFESPSIGVGTSALNDKALLRSLGGADARIAPLGSCVCSPIASKGRVRGVVSMTAKDGRRFTLADADLLTAISFQLGLAIENARLYERTDERLRENVEELSRAERRSRFLAEVGALLGSSMDVDTVMDLVARKTTELVGDGCAIYLLDAENDRLLRLKALYHAGAAPGDVEPLRDLLTRRPLEVGQGLIGAVAKDGQARLLAQIDREELSSENRYLAQSVEEVAVLSKVPPTSRIAAPLRSHGKTNGVLSIHTVAESAALQESDLALVTELADRLGVAVENMRLFHESQARRLRLEAIIRQMADGVVVTNDVGDPVVVNVAAEKMLGGQIGLAPDSKPQNGRKSKTGSMSPAIRALVMRALAGEMILGEEFNVGAPPMLRVLNASASPVRDDTREITGAVLVLRDVTVEREVDRMKEEFVATVSHELRTPITAVLGYTDILLRGLRGPLEPKQVEALSSVRTAGERLLALINDLLDISRLEAGAQDMLIRPLAVVDSINRAVDAFSGLALSREIELLQAVPVSLPLVQGDEELLQRILGNLLSNALKFTPEGGTVVVSAMAGVPGYVHTRIPHNRGYGPEQEVVSVMVTDTGIGVPREQQDRIWEKFQQADSSSRRSFGGTGLGLAIAKGLVELHGGTVWLESEGLPGKGSTFGFTLKVARSA